MKVEKERKKYKQIKKIQTNRKIIIIKWTKSQI